MAHFELAAEMTSKAIEHRTVDEIWYCVKGSAEMWSRRGGEESVVEITVGTCLTIPAGTGFQFRSGDEGLSAVAVTMPPWPGEDEATLIEGIW